MRLVECCRRANAVGAALGALPSKCRHSRRRQINAPQHVIKLVGHDDGAFARGKGDGEQAPKRGRRADAIRRARETGPARAAAASHRRYRARRRIQGTHAVVAPVGDVESARKRVDGEPFYPCGEIRRRTRAVGVAAKEGRGDGPIAGDRHHALRRHRPAKEQQQQQQQPQQQRRRRRRRRRPRWWRRARRAGAHGALGDPARARAQRAQNGRREGGLM